MIELTVSRKRRLNLGNYESEEVMAAVKTEAVDNTDIPSALTLLNGIVESFLNEETEKVRQLGKQKGKGKPDKESKAN